jgi:hypothetical protein
LGLGMGAVEFRIEDGEWRIEGRRVGFRVQASGLGWKRAWGNEDLRAHPGELIAEHQRRGPREFNISINLALGGCLHSIYPVAFTLESVDGLRSTRKMPRSHIVSGR